MLINNLWFLCMYFSTAVILYTFTLHCSTTFVCLSVQWTAQVLQHPVWTFLPDPTDRTDGQQRWLSNLTMSSHATSPCHIQWNQQPRHFFLNVTFMWFSLPMRFKKDWNIHGCNVLSMLITRYERGVANRPRPPATPASKRKVGVHTLGIRSRERRRVKVKPFGIRKYLHSGLLWCSRQTVPTTNAGIRHKIG